QSNGQGSQRESPQADQPSPREEAIGSDDMFEKDTPRRGNGHDDYASGERQQGRVVETYIYEDANRQPFMRVLRMDPKSFPVAHRVNGRWVNEWPPGPVVPYRLPELLAAPPDEPPCICEGEAGANSMAALGFVATTNPGGAKVWQGELAQYFKGRK